LRFSTWVEIDLDSLTQNIAIVRSKVGEDVRILLVVKADAYGHGAVEVARAALESGVSMLGVATLHEGIELRQAGVAGPVLILSPPMKEETAGIVEYDLSCTVPSLAVARSLSRACAARGKTCPIHVEIDTGMGRSGIGPGEALPFISAVTSLPGLMLEGIFTHFPSSDDDPEFTAAQIEEFDGVLRSLDTKGIEVPLRHAANSGAVLEVAHSFEAPLNMVRPGIMVYGLRPSAACGEGPELKPVMSFKSRIAQIRELPPGHGVSYGRTYVAPEAMPVGVVPVGYGHGYSFRLSNAGEVLVRGHRAPIIGRVTMDVTMIDLTGIPDAGVGDEVVLFGSQEGLELTVDDVAASAGTINYEVICGIGKRVARAYIRNGEMVGSRTLIERRVVGRRRW